MANKEFFHYCPDGADPRPITYVVLDANVLGAFTSMGYNGYDDANIEHRRAANLLRWLQQSSRFVVSDSLAILEGAGLHSGKPNPFELVRRSLYFRSLWSLSAEELEDWFSIGGPVIAYGDGAEVEERVRCLVEDDLKSLPWLLGPNYLAVLQLLVNDLESLPPRKGLTAVRDMFLDLNLVSNPAWMAATLRYYGNKTIPNMLRTGLLKTHGPDRRRSVISAALDLSYLSYLGQLKNDSRAQGMGPLHTVLVTADSALAQLHALLGFGEGYHYLFHDHLAAKTMEEWADIDAEMTNARALASPQRPTQEDIERLARPLEERLGIEPIGWDNFYDAYERRPDFEIQAGLIALYGLSPDRLVEGLCDLSREGDVLFEGLQMVHSMAAGIAEKGRLDVGPLADMIAATVRDRHGWPMPSIEEGLCIAFVKDWTWWGNALLQQVESFDKERQPSCALYVVTYMFALIDAMADMCELAPQVVATRQKEWVQSRTTLAR